MWEQAVWIAPLAVGLTGWRSPRWGFAVFAALLPFFGSPPGGPYMAALDVTAMAAVLVSLRAPRPEPSALSWPLRAFVAVSLASLVPLAYAPPSARPGALLGLLAALPGVQTWSALYTWRAAASLLLGWALFYAVRRAMGRGSIRPLGLGLAAGLAVVLPLGILEQVGLIDLGSYRAIAENLPTAERMHSVFFNSGWLAEYVVLAAPLAIATLVVMRRWVTATGLAVLALVAIVLCLSRGAWFAVLVQLAFLSAAMVGTLAANPALRRALAIGLLGFCVLLGAVLLAMPDDYQDALQTRLASSVSDLAGRGHLWGAAVELTRARPVLGWGLGSFAAAYDQLHPPGSPEAQRPRGTAHNWVLHVLAENGVLGLLALLVVAWAVGTALVRGRRGGAPEAPGRAEKSKLALGLAASLLGAAVYGLVQYIPYLKSVAWLLGLLLGEVACLDVSAATRTYVTQGARILLLVALVLLPFRALQPAPQWQGDRSYGLHEAEQSGDRTFRWIEPRAAMRLPWRADCLRLALVDGHPKAAERQASATVRVGGEERRIELTPAWREITFELGEPRAQSVLLEISAGPAFRPFADFRRYGLASSSDIRLLSAALASPEWQECARWAQAPER